MSKVEFVTHTARVRLRDGRYAGIHSERGYVMFEAIGVSGVDCLSNKSGHAVGGDCGAGVHCILYVYFDKGLQIQFE